MCNTHGKAGGLTKISRNPFPSQPINWEGHCIASNGSDRPSDIGPKDPTLGRLFKMSTEIVLLLTNNIVYLKPTTDQKVWLIFSKKMFLGFVNKVGFIHPLGSLGHLLVRVVIKQFCWFFVKMFWGLS